MASLSTCQKNGTRRLLFDFPKGKRRTVALGTLPSKQAEAIRLRVEFPIQAKLSGLPLDAETSVRLGKVDGELHAASPGPA